MAENSEPLAPPTAWKEDSLARTLARGVAGAVGVGIGGMAAAGLSNLVGAPLSPGEPAAAMGLVWTTLGVVTSLVLFLFALGGDSPRVRHLTRRALVGAIVTGGLAFAAGFIGPMILTPDANQGPLLGIFLTGPAGAALGALLGLMSGLGSRAEP